MYQALLSPPLEPGNEATCVNEGACSVSYLDNWGHPVYLVECLEVTYRWGLLSVVGKLVSQVGNEHAKLCSPVTNMVEPRGEGRGGDGREG